jgi:hypothetical protein
MLQVEARKRHEYLEAAVSVLDGHLRYFKAGYEALKKLEPFMHQVPLRGAHAVHSLHCCPGPRPPAMAEHNIELLCSAAEARPSQHVHTAESLDMLPTCCTSLDAGASFPGAWA